jgi:Holliday junction resolvase RusA-like endonuclease
VKPLIFGRAAEGLALAAGQPTAAGLLDSVELTLPPSTNNLFFTKGRKRIKTTDYRDWIEQAEPILRRLKRVPGPVVIVVRVRGAVNMQRDLDNLLKPLGDCLKLAEVIPDDSVKHVTGWDVKYVRGSKAETGRVVVSVETDKGE